MKRFLKALPLVLVGGVALTGCGSVDVDMHVKDIKKADVSVSVEATKAELNKVSEKSQREQAKQQGQKLKKGDVQKLPDYMTIGYMLDSNLFSPSQQGSTLRTALGKAEKVTSKETNHGDVMKAETTYRGLDMKNVKAASTSMGLPVSVTYDQGRYHFNLAPSGQMDLEGDVNFTIHLPRAVESASAGGEVHGHSVTWKLNDLKKGQAVEAVSETEGLAWWASLLIWLAGIIVTILLIVIAFLPSSKPKNGPTDEPGQPEPQA